MEIKAAFGGYSGNDMAACKEFYGGILGITLRDEMGGIGFDINGQQVFIYPKDDHQPATFTVLNFVVNDINAAIDGLIEKGVSFERYDDLPAEQDSRGVLRGKDAGMGPNIAWFKDPSDNILGLIEQ